jgi:hypothetical protein
MPRASAPVLGNVHEVSSSFRLAPLGADPESRDWSDWLANGARE